MAHVNLKARSSDRRPQPLFSGDPFEITNAWQDIGAEMVTKGVDSVGVWLDVDVNSSQNVRIRAIAKHEADGTDEYVLPIRTVSASDVKVEDEYVELNDDADQKILVEIALNELVPYIQLQIQDSNDGTGQIESAYVTMKR